MRNAGTVPDYLDDTCINEQPFAILNNLTRAGMPSWSPPSTTSSALFILLEVITTRRYVVKPLRFRALNKSMTCSVVLLCCAMTGASIVAMPASAAGPPPAEQSAGAQSQVGIMPLGSGDSEGCINVALEARAGCQNPSAYHSDYREVESWNSTGAGWGSCAEVEIGGSVRGRQCVGNIPSGYDEVYCIAKCEGTAGYARVENNSGGYHRFTLWSSWN